MDFIWKTIDVSANLVSDTVNVGTELVTGTVNVGTGLVSNTLNLSHDIVKGTYGTVGTAAGLVTGSYIQETKDQLTNYVYIFLGLQGFALLFTGGVLYWRY